MSSIRTASFRRTALDHFEPEASSDPQVQRKLRGQLEQIDYIAFAANGEVIARTLGGLDVQTFQKLAIAAAEARAQWAQAALAAADGHPATPDQIARVADLRCAYEELTEAYEGLRRMVERGYLTYRAAKAG